MVWCASPSLVGWHLWGKPGEEETRQILELLEQYKNIGTPFDVVADTRGVEVVNPIAVSLLVRWLFQHREELKRRVRVQANVIHRDPIGFLAMGVIASIGDIHPLRTYSDPIEAFRSVAGDEGARICDEVESVVARIRGLPGELQALRTLLASDVHATIRSAAKALGTSSRSLQRSLKNHGTSFHEELTNARFSAAKSLLAAGDTKIAAVATRVGWSERTLISVFRAKTGLTPTDWRRRETAAR